MNSPSHPSRRGANFILGEFGQAPGSDCVAALPPPPPPQPGPSGPPADAPGRRTAGWLYVSKKLDLAVLPDHPGLGETIWIGDVLHYRLTPPVYAWLWRAVGAYIDRRATKEQAAEAMQQMHRIDAWMEEVYPVKLLRSALDQAVKDIIELPKPIVSLEMLQGIDGEYTAMNRESES